MVCVCVVESEWLEKGGVGSSISQARLKKGCLFVVFPRKVVHSSSDYFQETDPAAASKKVGCNSLIWQAGSKRQSKKKVDEFL